MAYICDQCGKGSMIGTSHKHKPGVAGGRWIQRAQHTKKVFRPNLQRITLIINGMHKRMLLCTRCIRLLKKSTESISQIPAAGVAPTVSPA